MDDKRQKTLISSVKAALICGDSAEYLPCRDVSSSDQMSDDGAVSDAAQAVNCSSQSRDITDRYIYIIAICVQRDLR